MDYYRTYARISLESIIHNAVQVKKRLEPGTLVMALVKADAYGNGANEVAAALEGEVDYFGVAALEEAVALRENGIKKPVLILAYSSPTQYESLVKNDITQTIYDTENAKLLSDCAVRAGKKACVHIAVDTGMTRIGFGVSAESADAVKEIYDMPGLAVEGIFSHYACADSEELSDAHEQFDKFKQFLAMLSERGVDIPIKHLSNSAGTLSMPAEFNMVRLGILLYGLYPDEWMKKYELGLVPSMEIISHIANVTTVPEGTGVSYGHAFVTSRPTRVATVCIGYADGYPRLLSGKGRVIINGKYAPVIGRVCMDLMMVDVTDIEGVKTGDSVVVMGKSGDCEVTAEELAELSDTINYEIICSFKNRVKRIYE